jgi:5-methylcytosine-specific restriction enzyme subunit McrC
MIPVNNLFYLLSYVWDVNWELEWSSINANQSVDVLNLLTKILTMSTDRLIRRGLDRGYKDISEDVFGVRGRIDIARTIKRIGFANSKLTCDFEELSHSVIHNQIIKSTLENLSKADGLDKKLREEVINLLHLLQVVEPIKLNQNVFSKVRFHSNISNYRLPLAVSKLIYDQLLPTQETGKYQFVNISEEKLHTIFEKFVFKYYEKHLNQTIYTGIKRDTLPWQNTYYEEGLDDFLPVMKTDVSLFNGSSKLVVECKFYEAALQSRKIEGKFLKERFISNHLFQLFAYMKNLEIKDSKTISGLILYPKNGKTISSFYSLHGHKVSIRTIDLDTTPEIINCEMLSCLAQFRGVI